MTPKPKDALDLLYDTIYSIARAPLTARALSEPDDFDPICGECGESLEDCPGHFEAES